MNTLGQMPSVVRKWNDGTLAEGQQLGDAYQLLILDAAVASDSVWKVLDTMAASKCLPRHLQHQADALQTGKQLGRAAVVR
jgi:hypothetical protein